MPKKGEGSGLKNLNGWSNACVPAGKVHYGLLWIEAYILKNSIFNAYNTNLLFLCAWRKILRVLERWV